jgi:uncharacterized protein YuzE
VATRPDIGLDPADRIEARPAEPQEPAVRFDDDGNVIGITIVNAKWLLERDAEGSVSRCRR